MSAIVRFLWFGSVLPRCVGECRLANCLDSRDHVGTRPRGLVVSQFEISALGGKWTSDYWPHRQRDAQIVSNLTSEQRRL